MEIGRDIKLDADKRLKTKRAIHQMGVSLGVRQPEKNKV